MLFRTEEEAGKILCPVARTFAVKDITPYCRGSRCMAWRWTELKASDPRFVAAVKHAMGEHAGNHKKAVAAVMADPAAYGLPEPERGYCGLGGC